MIYVPSINLFDIAFNSTNPITSEDTYSGINFGKTTRTGNTKMAKESRWPKQVTKRATYFNDSFPKNQSNGIQITN